MPMRAVIIAPEGAPQRGHLFGAEFADGRAVVDTLGPGPRLWFTRHGYRVEPLTEQSADQDAPPKPAGRSRKRKGG